MSVLLLLAGIVTGCVNIVAYSYLFLEAIINFEDIRENVKIETYHLPILGMNNDLGTFLIVSFIMSILSVLMVYGMVRRRTLLMWPWMLAAFQVLGNYGYFMLTLFTQAITSGPSKELAWESLVPAIIFVGQSGLYVVIFIIFKRMFVENITRRYDITRW